MEELGIWASCWAQNPFSRDATEFKELSSTKHCDQMKFNSIMKWQHIQLNTGLFAIKELSSHSLHEHLCQVKIKKNEWSLPKFHQSESIELLNLFAVNASQLCIPLLFYFFLISYLSFFCFFITLFLPDDFQWINGIYYHYSCHN